MKNKDIALRVQQSREDRRLTQKEVAAVLGSEQPAYSDRERGAIAFKAVELDKLASYYQMSLDELLHGNQPVVNMHDHASYGYINSQTQHGTNDETLKRLCDLMEHNITALRALAEQQAKLIELLAKRLQ